MCIIKGVYLMIYNRITNLVSNLFDEDYIKRYTNTPRGELYYTLNNMFNNYNNIEYIYYIDNTNTNRILSDYVICYNNIDDEKINGYLSIDNVLVGNKKMIIFNIPINIIFKYNDIKKLKDLMLLIIRTICNDLKFNTNVNTSDVYIQYMIYYILKTFYTFNDDIFSLILNDELKENDYDLYDKIVNIFEECVSNYSIIDLLDRQKIILILKSNKF